jgi:hypothetical protein
VEKATRTRIQNATQAARRLLEHEYTEQLEAAFDILRSGQIGPPPQDLPDAQKLVREKIMAAIRHKEAGGMKPYEGVADYIRDASFTTLNRFAALKMLEARGMVLECVSRGEESSGYKELYGLAASLPLLPDQQGYRLYLESIFDELTSEIKVLFDRRDVAALLWPRRQALAELLAELNDPDLDSVWGDDETIGWVYQYFNADADREKARYDEHGKPKAPQNSRELAVRNQFFTPRYVVQFLVDNTLGRTWKEMRRGQTKLVETCEYLVRRDGERYLDPGVEPKEDEDVRFRAKKDPRDLRILDPACGSGHFLLYSFDLLLTIYEEAWSDPESPASEVTGDTLCHDYETLGKLRRAMPGLILAHNLHGVEIDPRCAQIAALALWMRTQRAFGDFGIAREDRPPIRKTNIVIAEPMPGEKDLLDEFASNLQPPLLGQLVRTIAEKMQLAGELGVLLKIERDIASALTAARKEWDAGPQFRKQTLLFQRSSAEPEKLALDVSGISDAAFWTQAEQLLTEALHRFVTEGANGRAFRRKLFADDAEAALAMIDVCRARFDLVLMNPPFGAASIGAKKEFEKAYPRTRNDIYAAFVERGVVLLHPHGMVGAITSRTGFFLSSFQKWREEILLKEAPPVVFADLGYGVMDAAMVEAAAYCLEKSGVGT